jgi:hypothetical protein
MTYAQMKDLKPGAFKRARGVHPQTCETMLQVYCRAAFSVRNVAETAWSRSRIRT